MLQPQQPLMATALKAEQQRLAVALIPNLRVQWFHHVPIRPIMLATTQSTSITSDTRTISDVIWTCSPPLLTKTPTLRTSRIASSTALSSKAVLLSPIRILHLIQAIPATVIPSGVFKATKHLPQTSFIAVSMLMVLLPVLWKAKISARTTIHKAHRTLVRHTMMTLVPLGLSVVMPQLLSLLPQLSLPRSLTPWRAVSLTAASTTLATW